MTYIPKRVLFGQFPPDGVRGVSRMEALDLAIDGELAAYYQIPVPFDLIGASMVGDRYMVGSYGSFHGALARLPVGMLAQLQAQGQMTFDKSEMMQTEGFQSAAFGPTSDAPGELRRRFEEEEYFWLVFKEGQPLNMELERVIFLRDDLEQIADARTSGKPLDPRERATLERLLYVLAVQAKFTPKDEASVKRAAELLGLQGLAGKGTITKHLTAAFKRGEKERQV